MERIQDADILLVDDNAELLEMLQKILKREGFVHLYPAASCKEARGGYRSIHPDFMILDVNLPDGDGYYGYENTLMVHMRHPREKLEDNPSKPQYILTARTNWIAGVSHDIRTPLSMIMGYVEQLEAAGNIDTEQKKQLGIIRNQGMKIKKLIEDLNLTSKLEYQMQPLRKEMYHPAKLMREIAASYYNNSLSDAYTLELHIAEEVEKMELEGDVALLVRAFENLIGNSIRHNEGCNVEIRMRKQQNQLEILFRDDGVGIPEEVIACLMEEENEKEALEARHIMGMHVVKQIILAHNGEMVIEEAKIGAAIRILLPMQIDRREKE